jgi:hypothetical protein
MSCAVTTATPEQARSKAASARACAAVALPVPPIGLGACLPLHSRAGGSCSGVRRNAESGGSGRQLAGFLAGREKSENRLGARGRGQSEYGRGDAGGRARCRRRWWPGGCHLPCQVPVPCVCFQDDFFSFPRTPTRNIPALRQWLRPGNNK